ncbi:MAG TPA: hypothetical protein VFV38_51030 [Ktedonobacteraceae bacterium]|nr:hypothetical protein [Ktedonobacteraceae bacterium]
MVNRRALRRKGTFLAFVWMSVMLAVYLSMSLSACVTLFSANCSGVSISCNTGSTSQVAPSAAAQAQAVATMTAIKKKQPLIDDPLTGQDSLHWPVDQNCYFHSYFDHETYFVANTGSANGTYTCYANNGGLYLHDVAVQVDVTLILGDSAGIMFRATPDTSEFYEFMIGPSQFLMGRVGPGDVGTYLAPVTSSNAVRGLANANRLLVIMKGDDFRLFINGTFVGEVHDSTLTTGFVGLSLAYNPTGEASFSNFVVYPL